MRVLAICAALLLSAPLYAALAQSTQEPRPCCMAMTAQCLACSDGITPHQYCLKYPKTAGCKDPEKKAHRISYWSGKVNQHFADGTWKTDPDGKSGANIPKLTYCRKWWPRTDSVKKLASKETITFYTAGNKEAHVSTKDVFECVIKSHTQPPTSGDWCYDTAKSSHSHCEKLIAEGKCEWFVFDSEKRAKHKYECDTAADFIPNYSYGQKSYCGSLETVLSECQAECDSREDCSVFFYQEHNNELGCPKSPHGGYQICGFYNGKVERSRAVKGGHHAGSQLCYSSEIGDKPIGKCVEAKDNIVIKTDEDCTRFCKKQGFGCLDYRKGANQMLSCSQACHMRVKLDQTRDQCVKKCDRRGDSGCSLNVNGEVLSMCSRCEKHVFQKDDGTKCNFGVCSQDACKAGCGVTTATIVKPKDPPEKHCHDDNKKASAVCKGSCADLARNCGQKLACGDVWSGDVAVFCPLTCGKCDKDTYNEPEPCMMVDCLPGYDLVGTDSRGCGGECVNKKRDTDNEPEPCMMVDCLPGYDLVGTDSRGCGGDCVNKKQDNKPASLCCEAMTANCLACGLGLTVEEYCSKYPGKYGCSSGVLPNAATKDGKDLTGNRDNFEQNGLGRNAEEDKGSPRPTATGCPSTTRGSTFTAEFILASLISYLFGALSLWAYLKCGRRRVPTAPAAAVVNTIASRPITIIPVGGQQKAYMERAAVRHVRIQKPMFPPPPPPPRSEYSAKKTKARFPGHGF